MKHMMNCVYAILLVAATVSLTACPNNGGGSGDPGSSAAVETSGGYVGQGTWNGSLQINGGAQSQVYQNFLYANGICTYGYQCQAGYMQLQIVTGSTGYLPAPITAVISNG